LVPLDTEQVKRLHRFASSGVVAADVHEIL
jgi:hypothetical protein